jgi:hypothetical protein
MMKNNEIMFNGTVPICFFCKKPMKRYTPSKGPFKGQMQRHSFVCDCLKYPKGTVLSVG